MRRPPLQRLTAAGACLALVMGVAACGGGGGGGKAGTLEVVSSGGFDTLDPGATYYALTYQWASATHRTLYSYQPGDASHQVPDLATGPPRVSADAKTITVHLRSGVRFGPPVNREVTSADVKYAIERAFSKQVNNQWLGTYFGDLVGAPEPAQGDYREIPGILTPDAHTIVLKLTTPTAAFVSQALITFVTAPVPKEYARKYDEHTPSTYFLHQVATGAYMIERKGDKLTYQPDRRLVLVRNPNWDRKTDFRPAYVDRIDWRIGGDPTVIANQVLAGSHIVDADSVPAPLVKQAVTTRPGQIAFTTPAGNRYIALNTAIPPFNDINLRKAVSAAIDKTQLQLTRGGESTGVVATHYLPPGAPGFEQAGGLEGPGFDFDRSPTGDMAVAKKYLRAAGFPSGRYSGPEITVVAVNQAPGNKTAEVVDATLRNLGFKTKLRELEDTTVQSTCASPKRKVNVCPSAGTIPDFADGQAYLDVAFNGNAINPTSTPNWSQLDDPAINKAMDRAARLTDPTERAAAWARIDTTITATAAGIPWLWDKVPSIESKDVKGVVAKWITAWDLAFTSLR